MAVRAGTRDGGKVGRRLGRGADQGHALLRSQVAFGCGHCIDAGWG